MISFKSVNFQGVFSIFVIIILGFTASANAGSFTGLHALGMQLARERAPEDTRTTKQGHTFTRVGPEELKGLGVTDPAKFGEAWRDPSGVIWGDMAKDEKGMRLHMSHKDAEAYCKGMGAELPSGWLPSENVFHDDRASDFVRLREYMGARTDPNDEGYANGYTPGILPNLTYRQPRINYPLGINFWSASHPPAHIGPPYEFNGGTGTVFSSRGDQSIRVRNTRCVFRPQ